MHAIVFFIIQAGSQTQLGAGPTQQSGGWLGQQFFARTIDETQRDVTGEARLKLYRGSCTVVGRRAPRSLYNERLATFEADTVYNQRDAEGFIKLNALRLRSRAQLGRRT